MMQEPPPNDRGHPAVATRDASSRSRLLLRRGLALEYATLGWNIVGFVVVLVAAAATSSVALAGFGFDSGIEIFASIVVIWELTGAVSEKRQNRGLRLIGWAFVGLAIYIVVQSVYALATGTRAGHSGIGVIWLTATVVAMFLLAWGKSVTGRELSNPVLQTEARVTVIDGVLAAAVLVGLLLNTWFGWWWADPLAGSVIVVYAVKEARHIFNVTSVPKVAVT